MSTSTDLTDRQRKYLRRLARGPFAASDDSLAPGELTETWAARAEAIELGFAEADPGGWLIITDAGLEALDTPRARRVLRARA